MALRSLDNENMSNHSETNEEIIAESFNRVYPTRQINPDQIVIIKFLTLNSKVKYAKNKCYVERF